MLANLPEQILTKDGMKSTKDVLAGKKAVGIYFSAHWCPPCRMFTPILSKFYNDLKATNPDALEIIFCSSDQDQEAFDEYYGEQPWTSIQYGATEQDDLGQSFGVRGIPSFQICNVESGAIIDTDGRSTVMSNKDSPVGALSKWA